MIDFILSAVIIAVLIYVLIGGTTVVFAALRIILRRGKRDR